MSRKVELITDPECPNVEAAREQLRQAFAAVGESPSWDEWDLQAADVPAHAKLYGSPTVLVNGRDVVGEATESDANCCRVYEGKNGRFQGVPSLEEIVDALKGSNGSACC